MKIRFALAVGAALLWPLVGAPPQADAIMVSDLGSVPQLDPGDLTNLPEPNGCVYVDAGNLELPYVEGDRLACMSITEGENGLAEAQLCVYDEVYFSLFGAPAPAEPLACADAGWRWAFIGGPGACAVVAGVSSPAACVNGQNKCLTTLLGRTYMCWT